MSTVEQNIDQEKGRMLNISIVRYNPQENESKPRVESFEIQETRGMTIFIALNEIRSKMSPDLQYDFVCRAGICGSCGMIINGRPTLACRMLTSKLPNNITLAPLPGFELIGDLSVNTGKWMRNMSERLQTWIHEVENNIPKSTDLLEERMDPDLADKIYELDRCVECGCCIAGCGTYQMRNNFVGAVGLNKLARFDLDPRDKREKKDFYELVGDDDGVFGCMSLLGCEDSCPKDLPLQSKIAYMRRKMVSVKS